MSDQSQAIKADAPPAAPEAAAPPRRALRLPAEVRTLLGLVGVIALFIALLAGRGGLPSYLTADTVKLVLHQNAIQLVVVLGMLFVIVSGGIDLSVGSVGALAAVVAVLAYTAVRDATGSAGAASAAAVAAGVLAGGLCGLTNGLAVSWLRLTPFVATLGMFSIARGLAYALSGRTNITIGAEPAWVSALQNYSPRAFYFFDPGVWIALALAVAAAVVLRFTVFGRYCYAIGSNEATARLCGLPVERTKAAIYTLAGLLTGWAGILAFADESGGGAPGGLMGLELDVIAAAVIGGASLRGGRGSVIGVVLGVLLLGVLNDGVTRCGAILDVKLILMGVIVMANTALSQWQRRRTA
jgi:ribose transport system permease protein